MTIQGLRQEAKDLRDQANRVLLYDEKHSLDGAWRQLEELFKQVPLALGNRAIGFTLEGVPKNWDEISARADHIMRACDNAVPPTNEEIPGDYGT
jgi:hypothetical protein